SVCLLEQRQRGLELPAEVPFHRGVKKRARGKLRRRSLGCLCVDHLVDIDSRVLALDRDPINLANREVMRRCQALERMRPDKETSAIKFGQLFDAGSQVHGVADNRALDAIWSA